MSEMNVNQRDFVDFLIGLFNYRKFFIFILALFLSLGFYYEKYHNDSYKFKLYASIEDKSVLQDLVNYIGEIESANFAYSLYALGDVEDLDVPEKLDYTAFSQDLCGVLQSLLYDHKFFDGMANVYINAQDEFNLKMDDIDEISVSLRGMISVPTTTGQCTSYLISGPLSDVIFLEKMYISFLNSYITNEVSQRLVILKDFNLELASRVVNQNKKRTVLGLRELPSTDINYVKYSIENIAKSVTPLFIYVFCIFLAFLSHVIFVLTIDLVRQVKLRE